MRIARTEAGCAPLWALRELLFRASVSSLGTQEEREKGRGGGERLSSFMLANERFIGPD